MPGAQHGALGQRRRQRDARLGGHARQIDRQRGLARGIEPRRQRAARFLAVALLAGAGQQDAADRAVDLAMQLDQRARFAVEARARRRRARQRRRTHLQPRPGRTSRGDGEGEGGGRGGTFGNEGDGQQGMIFLREVCVI